VVLDTTKESIVALKSMSRMKLSPKALLLRPQDHHLLLHKREPEKEPSRPVLEPREPGCEYLTPIKAKVQGVFEYLLYIGIQLYTDHIFEVFGMNRTRSYESVSAESSWRLDNILSLQENSRDRLQIIGIERSGK